jgi:hypothetical protein
MMCDFVGNSGSGFEHLDIKKSLKIVEKEFFFKFCFCRVSSKI